MCRRRTPVMSIVVMVLLTLPVLAQEPDRGRTVRVDCSRRGASIARALESSADELVIEISGICHENLEIRRSNVTLRGASGDPALDGIHGVTTDPPAVAIVEVWDAMDVSFEDLTLTGGAANALNVVRSPRVILRNCRVVDNGFVGVFSTIGSSVYAERCDLSRNASGARASRISRFRCEGCTLADNSSWALIAYDHGTVELNGWWLDPSLAGTTPPDVPSSVMGEYGVAGSSSGSVYLTHTTIAAPAGGDPGAALLGTSGASVEAVLCSLEGSVRINSARGFLHQVTQTVPGPSSNSLRTGGQLQLSATSLVGPMDVLEFANVLIEYGSVVDGDVHCARAGDIWGDAGSVTGTVSDCPSWGGP